MQVWVLVAVHGCMISGILAHKRSNFVLNAPAANSSAIESPSPVAPPAFGSNAPLSTSPAELYALSLPLGSSAVDFIDMKATVSRIFTTFGALFKPQIQCGRTIEDVLKSTPKVSKKLKDDGNITELSLKENNFTGQPTNESWVNPESIGPVTLRNETTGCASYILDPLESLDIQSMSNTDIYSQNSNCTWTFEASSDSSKISIQCKPFRLKNCKKSSVQIIGGGINKIFCGNVTSGFEASSNTNKMKVIFKSKKKTRKVLECTVSASGTNRLPPLKPECIKCGTVNRETRIINGVETEVNEYPWQAMLVVAGTDNFFCGGVIYNDLFVMTAAHCAAVITGNNVKTEVLLGAHDINHPTSALQRIAVSNVYPHDSYNPITVDHDIALLQLATPATFNTYVKPACLPKASRGYAFAHAIVSGWGNTEDDRKSSVLLEANLRIIPNILCKFVYGFFITENMLCASSPRGSQSPYSGDSGGPLVIEENGEWIVVGLSSWVFNCGRQGFPAGFVRISRHLDFLADVASAGKDNLCPKK